MERSCTLGGSEAVSASVILISLIAGISCTRSTRNPKDDDTLRPAEASAGIKAAAAKGGVRRMDGPS